MKSRPTTGLPQPTGASKPMPSPRSVSVPGVADSTVPFTGDVMIVTWRPTATRSFLSGPWNTRRARSPGRGESPRASGNWDGSMDCPGFTSASWGRAGISITSVSRQRSITGWPTSTRLPGSTSTRSARWTRRVTAGFDTAAAPGATNRSGPSDLPRRPRRPATVMGPRSWFDARPDRALPVLEDRPPAFGAIGDLQRHLARVEEQPGEPTGDLEREAFGLEPQQRTVLRVELDAGGDPRRQVEQPKGARRQLDFAL